MIIKGVLHYSCSEYQELGSLFFLSSTTGNTSYLFLHVTNRCIIILGKIVVLGLLFSAGLVAVLCSPDPRNPSRAELHDQLLTSMAPNLGLDSPSPPSISLLNSVQHPCSNCSCEDLSSTSLLSSSLSCFGVDWTRELRLCNAAIP